MVIEIFGDMLYYPDSEFLQEFPSPAALMNHVILSTKPPKEYLAAKTSKEKNIEVHNGKESKEEAAWGKEVPDLQAEIESHSKVVYCFERT